MLVFRPRPLALGLELSSINWRSSLPCSLLLLHHAGLGPASKLLHLQFLCNTLTHGHALLSSAVTCSEGHRQLTRSS